VRVVHEKLEQYGVSVDVVYRLDLIELALERAETFVALLRSDTRESRAELAAKLMAALTAARLEERSLRDLIGDNTRLLARKIIERAGETGEHYITSSRREWWAMIASAGGGGFLTAGTCALKFLTKWGHFPLFVDGVTSSANYAASFVLMQLLGFTLATKQPSMTAAAIAGAIRGSKGKHEMDELVTMIARICRSQLAAVIGNLGIVIPTAIAFQMLYVHWTGHSFLDTESANTTIDSFHPWKSGTIFYAAFTGVLLWASSLGAGYLENWTVYRRLPEGISTHRWGRFFGRGTMRFFGRFLTKHVAGFGGNVTLGILLGMTPVLAKFFGLPIDVRHVTLSTGALTLSVCALGTEALTTAAVLAACGGIACMAVLNFGVSFVLALGVAFNARQVHAREAFRLLFQVIRRMFSTPTEFVFPPKVEAMPARVAAHH
jgi:site-specific recombinase